MNFDEVLAASDALEGLINEALAAVDAVGESQADRDAAAMALHLQLARLYLIEYCVHLKRGASDDVALAATARGELELTAIDDYRRQLH